MLVNLGTDHMIKISKSFYNDVIELIKQKYYPYIYIYEIVGDSFMFIINADWTYNIEIICATIGMDFVKNLIKKTESYVQIRVGISYGKLSYGKIGNNLRFFGQIVNMSSRLESISIPKTIVTSIEFWDKFTSEIKLIKLIKNNTDTINHVQKDVELKGFGVKKCIFIDVNDIDSLFVNID
jgi:class 3 adenylate cyclase